MATKAWQGHSGFQGALGGSSSSTKAFTCGKDGEHYTLWPKKRSREGSLERTNSLVSFFDKDFCPTDWLLKRRKLRAPRRLVGKCPSLSPSSMSDIGEAGLGASSVFLDGVRGLRKRAFEVGLGSSVALKCRKLTYRDSPSGSLGMVDDGMDFHFSLVCSLNDDAMGVVAGLEQHPSDQ